MEGVSISRWGNHYKEEKDSTIGLWQLSFRATIPDRKTIVIAKSCVEVWYQTDGHRSKYSLFLKKTHSIQNTENVVALLLLFPLKKSCLSVPWASHTNVQFKSYLSIPGYWHLHTCIFSGFQKMLEHLNFLFYLLGYLVFLFVLP